MRFKNKIKCEECGNLSRNLYGKEFNLCRRCFNKGKKIISKGMPIIFEEKLNVSIQPTQIYITKSHGNKLEKRLNKIFPNRPKNKYRFSKISQYIRMLILNDIDSESCREANR